jgi:hypothetical protein
MARSSRQAARLSGESYPKTISVLKALPDVEIIEIEPIVAEFLHGQRLSSIKLPPRPGPSVRNSRFAQGIQACGSVNGKSRPNFTN